ncbi:uncharacterized protein LOC118187658 isoform X2 [Stegodyphus dumicola]|uniref:uncharacterized protein LOC118187658 isoform X2 n=1 Tax=Stegodyphus dumicola TaxID=202533 RepID=UPI0015A79477|nr:uncharacterized protein LOC118187658 isoform X2 [Stegodyphus dumicola]
MMNDPSKQLDDDAKLKNIIGKLKNFGTISDDQKFGEMMTKPGPNRYILIEQILSKLKYPVPESCHISDEEKLKYLHLTLSNLGICEKNDDGVIKGTAPFSQQMNFWERIIDILWMKSTILSSSLKSDESYTSGRRKISVAYEETCSYINKLCNSVDLNILFDEKVQLFPLSLEKSIEQSSETCINDLDIHNLKHSRSTRLEEQYSEDCGEMLAKGLSMPKCEDLFSDSDDAIIKLEEKLDHCIDELQFCAQNNFKDHYDTLKSYTSASSPSEVLNIGPKFKKVVPKMASLLQLKNSLKILKISDSKLKDVVYDVKSLESSDNVLTGK